MEASRRGRRSTVLLAIAILVWLCCGPAEALEVYSGRDFPPVSAIKATYEAYDANRRTFDIVLGKVRLTEAADTYQLYYQWRANGEIRQDNDIKLVMLDTNIWAMHIGTQKFVIVIK